MDLSRLLNEENGEHSRVVTREKVGDRDKGDKIGDRDN